MKKPDFESFARAIMDKYINADGMGIDMDGGEVQDLAEKHGVMKVVKMTEYCDEEGACGCRDYGADLPTDCYRVNY